MRCARRYYERRAHSTSPKFPRAWWVEADRTPAPKGTPLAQMDPLEWLARMADHIPDPRKHHTLFYSHHANRVRGDRAAEEPGEGKVEDEPAKKRRGSASWARLIAKIFHADPLTCRKCGGNLKIVAYLHDHVAIKQILEYLGLSPPEEPKPPPAAHEVVRMPVDDEGR